MDSHTNALGYQFSWNKVRVNYDPSLDISFEMNEGIIQVKVIILVDL